MKATKIKGRATTQGWLNICCAIILGTATFTQATEVGFVEDFALADDRAKVLEQLIPGTDDYYYYTCLHHQNEGEYENVDKVLKQWLARHKGTYTNRSREIANRQALLQYDADPNATYNYIQNRLRLNFHHQKQQLDTQTNHPTELNQNNINWKTLRKKHGNDASDYEQAAFEYLAREPLVNQWRRNILSKISTPDIPNLPEMIIADLNYKHSSGFGSLAVHKNLTKLQLQECLKLQPKLLDNSNWINSYLLRLQPAAHVDWKHDSDARDKYLSRLLDFTKKLSPVHNSLKANILFQKLKHNLGQNIYNRNLFLDYLKLPRQVSYINSKYFQKGNHNVRVNMFANFRAHTQLSPITNDEGLVKKYLSYFFLTEANYKQYSTYISDNYLKRIFAETKIVNNLGDMEQWYSMLNDASYYKELKDRADLDFAPTNKHWYDADDTVKLDLYLKNVDKLIVKVFEVNTENYYRTKKKEISADIDLDGLEANDEKTYTYSTSPFERVKRSFTFDKLNGAGVFVIEFIGNGQSSRAVIRKGKLRYISRDSVAGHILTVLNDKNEHVPDATAWLGGTEYSSDKKGRITIPYSTASGNQSIILKSGSFATLDTLNHKAETYTLNVGFHVDRESLIKGHTAKLLVRPVLTVNATNCPLAILEDITLHIRSTDRDGISSTQVVSDFKIQNDSESVHEFKVPDKLSSISFTLEAKINQISEDKKIKLTDSRQFKLNDINSSTYVEDLHFVKTIDGYYVDLLGITGEVRPNRPVYFKLKHRLIRQTINLWLQTDDNGRIGLGQLKDISYVTAKGPEGVSHTWTPHKDLHTATSIIHAESGAEIRIPWMSHSISNKPDALMLSLFEKRAGSIYKELHRYIELDKGHLVIPALVSGEYTLVVKNPKQTISIRVATGESRDGYILGETQLLEQHNNQPIQIDSVTKTKNELIVQLSNTTKSSRLHLLGTRYMPGYNAFDSFNNSINRGPVKVDLSKVDAQYLTGRNIGDEFRYVLERRDAKRFPGNMLQRPSLLLNPWSIRSTETARDNVEPGTMHAPRPLNISSERTSSEALFGSAGKGVSVNLDFLPKGSIISANLRPDKSGQIIIPLSQLSGKQQIHLIAIDPLNIAYRSVSLKEKELEAKDLRLKHGLDPAEHYVEQKLISTLHKNQSLEIDDITNADLELIDTIGKAYQLLSTISKNPTLAEFSFIVRWPSMNQAEKMETYSKYSCHELNFFLFKKDKSFFQAVIKPYLANKKDKTFMDQYLLNTELSAFRKPWAFARLNIVERILLSERIPREQSAIATDIRDLYELNPPNIERYNYLYRTALQRSVLAAGKNDAKALFLRSKLQAKKSRQRMSVSNQPYAKGSKDKMMFNKSRLSLGGVMKQAKKEMPLDSLSDDESEREELDEGFDDDFGDDFGRRAEVRRLYRKVEPTMEWVENNYYHLPQNQQMGALISNNPFWVDYAAYVSSHEDNIAFVSPHMAEASRNFTDIMLALAVLDLPFQAEVHSSKYHQSKMELIAASNTIVFHQEIRPAKQKATTSPILISQNFFRLNDRYSHQNGERLDKYVTDEFLDHVVYGCQVVLTNPTAANQKIDVLLQIPKGALPVNNSFYTKSNYIRLAPHGTQTFEYNFYFPATGTYDHFPVHVSKHGKLLTYSEPATFKVVEKLSSLDKQSWHYISQFGTEKQVLYYLNHMNLHRIKLEQIAWRMKDRDFFAKTISILKRRHLFNLTLWSYGLRHRDLTTSHEYLKHRVDFVRQCGLDLHSPLVDNNPIEQLWYEHIEYKPLVNPRAHQFGKHTVILNNRLKKQYESLLKIFTYRKQRQSNDNLALTYYMLLQDRIADAITFFNRIERKQIKVTIQYDYLKAYLSMYQEDIITARSIAETYKNYSVNKWANKFQNILNQLAEIEGERAIVADVENRTQVQGAFAATAPSLEFAIEGNQVKVSYQNLEKVTVNYYKMDLELLFSRQPFAQKKSGQFSLIKPNHSEVLALAKERKSFDFTLPDKFQPSNVMIEISGGGRTESKTYFANALSVQMIENYGQLRVTHRDTNKALSKAYVKVYARRNGVAKFYKDGYTDLRGRFDYATLSTEDVSGVDRFAILIMSDDHGAVVREVAPPKQ